MNIQKREHNIKQDLLSKQIVIQKYYIKPKNHVQKDNKFYSKILE